MTDKQLLVKKEVQILSRNTKTGGQSVGVLDTSITLFSDILNITIKVGESRSQHRNKEIADTLMDLVIIEIIK